MRRQVWPIVVLLLLLASCAGKDLTSVTRPQGPAVPADLVQCFNRFVPAPAGTLTKQQVFKLIASLKRSELEKSQCGKRLVRWHNANR